MASRENRVNIQYVLMFHILILHTHFKQDHATKHLPDIFRETPSDRGKKTVVVSLGEIAVLSSLVQGSNAILFAKCFIQKIRNRLKQNRKDMTDVST